MFSKFKKDEAVIFAAGAAAVIGVNKFLKSKVARELAVKTVSSGLQFKDEVEHQIASIKEEAEDVIADAKVEAGLNEFPENVEEVTTESL